MKNITAEDWEQVFDIKTTFFLYVVLFSRLRNSHYLKLLCADLHKDIESVIDNVVITQ